ncbi:hypothetical protein PENANT_c016G06902 [Penicillium antarcticum]|uniref:Choline kinase N-terminal domain-containing protein n=1 Tax=Penicillium antarcticum TaxID=416450 RepID=A0A1V6Q4D2_9EURO|nr:uncharacterized protein N7508_001312 [Penicillium antarcticum]KAJ5316804.1 hypothetical protein N7508_001312 [Penicillium antarcticum]OQD83596.1 hypothetical protein PENANT_c016G06902 [Penicillium antarcticum]
MSSDKNGGYDPEVAVDSPPISGTGLNIPSRKSLHAGGTTPASPPDTSSLKQYRAPVPKATARPAVQPTHMPSTISSQASAKLGTLTLEDNDWPTKPEEDLQLKLFHQVSEWLQNEKSRQTVHKAKQAEATSKQRDGSTSAPRASEEPRSCSGSVLPLEKLEEILVQYSRSRGLDSLDALQSVSRASRRRPKGLRRGSASDSDYADFDAPVPGVEAVLDNSKTLAYNSSVAADDDIVDISTSSKRSKDREAWQIFRAEILRLAHTLQLRGWRKVPTAKANDIEVVRLSGALTNAVYVVQPPKNLPPPKSDSNSLVPRKPPPKLLLRIYGPQAEHLIDREKELQILRRLGRKNIGPRVLGTFKNGRFEQFLEARTLTAKDLRIPETAKHIAKRMRELHDGIDLLKEEREGGPRVFQDYEKWVDHCEKLTSWLDKEVQSPENKAKAATESWRRRGFVFGVPWSMFRKAVDQYRTWLVATCGGMEEIKRQLVFAHNDTQYGNLLRMQPATESPLLLPANEHKQLVVIDFEYASANTRGYEFANHFTEWCYNYHDEERSWACNNRAYPTPEEQYRFISNYLTHRPASVAAGHMSPVISGRNAPAITPLDLDENPTEPSWHQAQSIEQELEKGVRDLMKQTRLWRVISSVNWATWGIVQAKIPGMKEGIAKMAGVSDDAEGLASSQAPVTPPVESDAEEEEGFDYLAYAQDRAMFFWSDLLQLGLVKPEELPADLVEHIRTRIVDY